MTSIQKIEITSLLQSVGIQRTGYISLDDNMSGIETNPKNDWLYIGLNSLKRVAQLYDDSIKTAAFIGSGNGIDVIGAMQMFNHLKKIIVTDILPDILYNIEKNIMLNKSKGYSSIQFEFKAGRDCFPLEEKVDLIYANLPLVMVEPQDLNTKLATTTLTDINHYLKHSLSEDDILTSFSLLSQLGFLLSARDKLNENGRIITLIGGRVPLKVIESCFERSNLRFKKILAGFMRQSDPQFLQYYSQLELRNTKIHFNFYNYQEVIDLLEKEKIYMPDIFAALDEKKINQLLKPLEIKACDAYKLYCSGYDVGHLAFAFEAYL